MPTNHTSSYNLSQWVKSDQVRMEDFNADNAKIDAAIKAVNVRVDGKAETSALSALSATVTALSQTVAKKQDAASAVKFAAGSYTGNGASSRTISVGFTPKAVLVVPENGAIAPTNSWRGGLAVTGHPVVVSNLGASVTIVSGGFTVAVYAPGYQGIQTNESNTNYHYIAFA